jgi:HSP20 family molecular chaperone IbpA
MTYFNYFDELFKSWDRPVKEAKGWQSTETDYGYVIVANVLGIDKENIKLELNKSTLSLVGKTEVKEINFTNSVSYSWDISNIIVEIEKIEYQVKNGLVYIQIFTEKNKKPKILIDYKN